MWNIKKVFMSFVLNTLCYYVDILEEALLKIFLQMVSGSLNTIPQIDHQTSSYKKLIFSFSGYFDICNEKACCCTFIRSLKVYIYFNTKSNWKSRPGGLYNLVTQANVHSLSTLSQYTWFSSNGSSKEEKHKMRPLNQWTKRQLLNKYYIFSLGGFLILF